LLSPSRLLSPGLSCPPPPHPHTQEDMEEHELKEAILKFRYDAATDFVGQRVLRTFTGTYNRKNQKKKPIRSIGHLNIKKSMSDDAVTHFHDAVTHFVGQFVLCTFTGTYHKKNQMNGSSKCHELDEL